MSIVKRAVAKTLTQGKKGYAMPSAAVTAHREMLKQLGSTADARTAARATVNTSSTPTPRSSTLPGIALGPKKNFAKTAAPEGPVNMLRRAITAGDDPASRAFAGNGYGIIGGGIFGAASADKENRQSGAIWGAIGGGIGGNVFRAYAKKGAGISDSLSKKAANWTTTSSFESVRKFGEKHGESAYKNLAGMHTAQGRNNMFRSGAFLGGMGFSMMFASNGNSHKRGFNANRGNSFTR
jgi:hypothetical protein